MTKMWFQLQQISKDIKVLMSYSDLWNFVRMISQNSFSTENDIIEEAHRLIEKYSDVTETMGEQKDEQET